ncbi:hypothetical protein GLW05_06505 [Pontibacillus yanchengensis]|uniref:Uncharacterized protein n=1 Tax=Pontibacillus yanchengensis TaxID=462910 RepID=A0A6I4ZZ17_9BACI|nr:hypothetical protein [Pontibacillus yanchengensis]MYL33250.1 hypothetical protein [Pontibacillus yanchengensis]
MKKDIYNLLNEYTKNPTIQNFKYIRTRFKPYLNQILKEIIEEYPVIGKRVYKTYVINKLQLKLLESLREFIKLEESSRTLSKLIKIHKQIVTKCVLSTIEEYDFEHIPKTDRSRFSAFVNAFQDANLEYGELPTIEQIKEFEDKGYSETDLLLASRFALQYKNEQAIEDITEYICRELELEDGELYFCKEYYSL